MWSSLQSLIFCFNPCSLLSSCCSRCRSTVYCLLIFFLTRCFVSLSIAFQELLLLPPVPLLLLLLLFEEAEDDWCFLPASRPGATQKEAMITRLARATAEQ